VDNAALEEYSAVSETERNGGEPEGAGLRYLSRKEVAEQLGIHEKTVAEWERRGAFVGVAGDGKNGKKRYEVASDGRVALTAAFRCETTSGDTATVLGAVEVIPPAVVALALRETKNAIQALPQLPDPVKEALKDGEPTLVVAARARARGETLKGVFIALGLVVATLIAGMIYLFRHGRLPARR
jgi:hypothetical protein